MWCGFGGAQNKVASDAPTVQRLEMQECTRLEEQRQRQEVPRQQKVDDSTATFTLPHGGFVQLEACERCRQPRRCADKRRAVGVLFVCVNVHRFRTGASQEPCFVCRRGHDWRKKGDDERRVLCSDIVDLA